VKQRGLMCLAIFGNIVTSWSWFGTNMLGIGLHSYGFTEAAFWWLSAFVASQLALIAVANLPLAKWRSFRAGREPQAIGFFCSSACSSCSSLERTSRACWRRVPSARIFASESIEGLVKPSLARSLVYVSIAKSQPE
jgi:hypothetical protein